MCYLLSLKRFDLNDKKIQTTAKNVIPYRSFLRLRSEVIEFLIYLFAAEQ